MEEGEIVEGERVVEREISGDLRPTAMDAAKLEQLKLFISRCKSDPSILSDPYLSFFRDYLESLGAKLPASAYKTESQSVHVSVVYHISHSFVICLSLIGGLIL
ncbi:putative hsp70-interacting protein [Helianthus annuus]|nr:putative hsp70-interacting protein [Helianthus annuus]